jgi:hypothetical protein
MLGPDIMQVGGEGVRNSSNGPGLSRYSEIQVCCMQWEPSVEAWNRAGLPDRYSTLLSVGEGRNLSLEEVEALC